MTCSIRFGVTLSKSSLKIKVIPRLSFFHFYFIFLKGSVHGVRMKMVAMRWPLFLIDFFYPKRCVGCDASGTFLCERCLEKLRLHRVQGCPICRTPRRRGMLCDACRGLTALDRLFVLAPYEKGRLLPQVIQSMKYRHTQELAVRLGRWMGENVSSDFLSGADLLVPVPLHPQRQKERGYNQAELLAKGVSERFPLPVSGMVIRTRPTSPQAQLSRTDRLKNVVDAFQVKSNTALLNKKIVLIDDVCSTGSTLQACACAIKKAGAAEVWAVVLARGG